MMRRGAAGLVLAICLAAPAVGGTLHSLTTRGRLLSCDPATAWCAGSAPRVVAPGHVVTATSGLGVDHATGTVYGLAYLAEPCSDPSRTIFVQDNAQDYGCSGLTQEVCEQAFEVVNGKPRSCAWLGNAGCELCNHPEQGCIDACAPPPACPATPSRPRFAGVGAASCARHDGDPGACGEAYFVDKAGPSTCFVDGTACRGCDVAAAIAGQCTRDCAPPAPCADPARTLYVGTGNDGCGSVGADAAACATAYSEFAGFAMTCHLGSDGLCYPACSPWLEAEGFCTNTCTPSPGCPGDPERTLVQSCYELNGQPDSCSGAFVRDFDGTFECFLQDDGFCAPCGEHYERLGLCINACAPPVCEGDPGRTTLVDDGPEGCHAFDGDQAGCEQAFHVGRCGEAPCVYDAGIASCRPCAAHDPEGCVNTCGEFAPLSRRQTASLLTVDPGAATATVVTGVAGHMAQAAPGEGGRVFALGARSPDCGGEEALLAVDPTDGSADLVAPLALAPGGALAFHPTDGLLHRLVRSGDDVTLFVTDPMTGITTQTPATGAGFEIPYAMTWADACNAFVVSSLYGRIMLLDPVAAHLTETALFVGTEYDEGEWIVGLHLEGDTCPILELPTTTTTSTSTSTTSSTSTSTLPNELVAGTRLTMTDDAARPGKRRFELRSNDRTIALGGGNGSADDPVLHGGSLRIASTAGTFDAIYALDDGWRHLGKSGRDKGYKRTGKGPIRAVVLRSGRSLEITGKGADLAHPLLVDPGAVRIVLRLGSRQWCLEFGGTDVARTPRKLVVRDAPAPTACLPPAR